MTNGQFGHVADDTKYSNENNVFFISTKVKPTDTVSLSLGVSYVDSQASMDTIMFGPITAEAQAELPHPYYDFTEVHMYSDLEMTRIGFNGNLNVMLASNWGWYLGFLYDDYEDDAPYLVDTTGNYYWLYSGFRFMF